MKKIVLIFYRRFRSYYESYGNVIIENPSKKSQPETRSTLISVPIKEGSLDTY